MYQKMMFLLGFLLILKEAASQSTLTSFNSTFPTLDGLGYAWNYAQKTTLNLPPTQNYQTITQYSNQSFQIKFDINNPYNDLTMHLDPSIVLDKLVRRSNFRSIFKINVSLAMSWNAIGYSAFVVDLDMRSNKSDPSTDYKIEILLICSAYTLNNMLTVTVSSGSYIQHKPLIFYPSSINDNTWNGVIDLDGFLNYYVNTLAVNVSSICKDVKLRGQFVYGAATGKLDYSMIYDTLVYMDSGVVGVVEGQTVNLQLAAGKLAANQYVEVQTPPKPTLLTQLNTVYKVGTTDNTLKGYSQLRGGSYGGDWITPYIEYGFPLNPLGHFKYIASFTANYTGGTSDVVAYCLVFRTRTDFNNVTYNFTKPNQPNTREIHICPFWKGVAESQGTLIDSFSMNDELGNSYSFKQYENNLLTPIIHTFQASNTIMRVFTMDYYFFVRKLATAGKISASELISGYSLRFRVYSGSGQSSIQSLTFPSKPYPCADGYYGFACLPCNIPLPGCLLCTVSTICLVCDTASQWILNSSQVCACSIGSFSSGSGSAAVCTPCSTTLPHCLSCFDSQTCLTCDTINNWALNGTTCNCSSGYYLTSTTCTKCSLAGCIECNSTGGCVLCDSSNHWSLIGSTCVCEGGYYQVGIGQTATCGLCDKAMIGCVVCSNANTCSQCNSLAYWVLSGGGKCVCNMGYYLNTTVCSSCGVIPGCLSCTTSSICTTCNDSAHWLLANSTCYCIKGYTQSGQSCLSQTITPSMEVNTSLTCIWPQKNQTLETCLNASSVKVSVLLNVVTSPNLVIFLKVSQIFAFIDDFTFFIYHNISYGDNFDRFTSFMWNLTNQRFIPQSIAFYLYDLQDSYDAQTNVTDTTNVPQKWVELNEGAAFVNNTRDCWMSYLISNIVLFYVGRLIYRILIHFKVQWSARLISTRWVSILVTSIIIQNIQYMAFRSFQQILYGGSPYVQRSLLIYYFNQILCYLWLFFISVYACCGYVVLQYLIRDNVKYALDFLTYQTKTAVFLGITQVIKVVNGFAHAWFYSNPLTQISFLLFGQFFALVSIILFRKLFRYKSVLILTIVQYILRVIIHLFLSLRIYFSEKNTFDYCNQVLDESFVVLIYSIVGITLFEIIFSYVVEEQLRCKRVFKFFNNHFKKTKKVETEKIILNTLALTQQQTLPSKTEHRVIKPKKILKVREKNDSPTKKGTTIKIQKVIPDVVRQEQLRTYMISHQKTKKNLGKT